MAKNVLSVFIDESGDFGPYESHAPYYIVAMILHEQSDDITQNISVLNKHIISLNFPEHAIHTGPLIRRESVYLNNTFEERKRLFSALFNFARKLPFSYLCTVIKKSECPDVISLTSKLSKSIADILKENIEYFRNFDEIVIYYDNGQIELTKILTSLFNAFFSNVEFRKVTPIGYKLFQVADLICTMELLSKKAETKSFSSSERAFFGSERDFKKNYYKWISRKHI